MIRGTIVNDNDFHVIVRLIKCRINSVKNDILIVVARDDYTYERGMHGDVG